MKNTKKSRLSNKERTAVQKLSAELLEELENENPLLGSVTGGASGISMGIKGMRVTFY